MSQALRGHAVRQGDQGPACIALDEARPEVSQPSHTCWHPCWWGAEPHACTACGAGVGLYGSTCFEGKLATLLITAYWSSDSPTPAGTLTGGHRRRLLGGGPARELGRQDAAAAPAGAGQTTCWQALGTSGSCTATDRPVSGSTVDAAVLCGMLVPHPGPLHWPATCTATDAWPPRPAVHCSL